MNTEIKKLRKEIWELLGTKIPALFEDATDEEAEFGADLEVNLSVGKYAGATSFEMSNGGGELTINVYPSGLVNVYFDEVCHCKKQFTLCDDLNAEDTNTKQIVSDIATLLDIFLTGYWHIFMDYVVKYKDDWRKAVTEYLNSNAEDFNTTYIYI